MKYIDLRYINEHILLEVVPNYFKSTLIF